MIRKTRSQGLVKRGNSVEMDMLPALRNVRGNWKRLD